MVSALNVAILACQKMDGKGSGGCGSFGEVGWVDSGHAADTRVDALALLKKLFDGLTSLS